MTDQTQTPGGQIVWHDLMTTDLEPAKEFYQALFGWTTHQQDMGPMGDYTVIQHQGQPIGGMVNIDPQHGLSSHWLAYLTVEDVEELCARIPKLGGSVAVEPRGVPEVGRFAILHDPANGVFSAMQMAGEAGGPPRTKDHGMFYWDQLLTNNSDVLGKFYGEVFGWTVDKYEMGDLGYYGIFKRGEQSVAGMLPLAPDDARKPGWLPYIAVEDIDASVEKVKELKAEVITGPDVVYGIGKYAVVRDPTGGVFGLYKPAG